MDYYRISKEGRLHAFFIVYPFYVFIGYLGGFLKEIFIMNFSSSIDFSLSTKKYSVYDFAVFPFITLMLLFSFKYNSGGFTLNLSSLYYLAPFIIAIRYGARKAFAVCLWFIPLFIFSFYIGYIRIGFPISYGELVLFSLLIYMLGQLKYEQVQLTGKLAGYFAFMLLPLTIMNATYYFSKHFWITGADFILPLVYLSGYLMGSLTGFYLGIAWGVLNIVHYRVDTVLLGVPDIYILAAPLIGYLGGTIRARKSGLLNVWLIILLFLNLAYIFRYALSGNSLLWGAKYEKLGVGLTIYGGAIYVQRVFSMLQGIVMFLLCYPIAICFRENHQTQKGAVNEQK